MALAVSGFRSQLQLPYRKGCLRVPHPNDVQQLHPVRVVHADRPVQGAERHRIFAVSNLSFRLDRQPVDLNFRRQFRCTSIRGDQNHRKQCERDYRDFASLPFSCPLVNDNSIFRARCLRGPTLPPLRRDRKIRAPSIHEPFGTTSGDTNWKLTRRHSSAHLVATATKAPIEWPQPRPNQEIIKCRSCMSWFEPHVVNRCA